MNLANGQTHPTSTSNPDAASESEEQVNVKLEKTQAAAGFASVFCDVLPPSVNDETFKSMFLPFATNGTIKSILLKRHQSGPGTGYGFVEFESPEDGKAAVEALNGKFIDGLYIRVTRARPPRQVLDNKNLYVEDLPLSWEDTELRAKFEVYGGVRNVKVLVSKGPAQTTNVGFVDFYDPSDAKKAVDAVHNIPDSDGVVLRVKFAKRKRRLDNNMGMMYGGGRSRGRGRGFGRGMMMGRGRWSPFAGYGSGFGGMMRFGPMMGMGGMRMSMGGYGRWCW